MKQKLLEHLYSILFVGIILIIVSMILNTTGRPESEKRDPLIQQLSDIVTLRPEHPLHRTLIRESMKSFFPKEKMNSDSLIDAIAAYRRQNVLAEIEAARSSKSLTIVKFTELVSMYGSFLFAFLVVMAFIYYGAQSLGLYQFVHEKKGNTSQWRSLLGASRALFSKAPIADRKTAAGKILLIKMKFIAKAVFYAGVFSPAYVVAYSFKTNFETDSIWFLILLGIFTNGILITFMHKFYSLLNIESRKGYVETALTKGLSRNYQAVGYRALFNLRKHFPDHVLDHIFINTRYQFIASIKEQGSTVITGLIIIEMALNIQGHLGYELLKNTLYRNWDVVLIIVFGIFLLVKAIETMVDLWLAHESNKYENRHE